MARASSSPLFPYCACTAAAALSQERGEGWKPSRWVDCPAGCKSHRSQESYFVHHHHPAPRDDLIYFFHPSGLCKRFFFLGGGWRMRERGNIYFWQGPFVVHQGHTHTRSSLWHLFNKATSVSPISQIRPKRRRRRRRRRRP